MPRSSAASRPTTDRAFQAALSRDFPRIPFDTFIRTEFNWQRGEHVAMIGPTGQGKTNLQLAIQNQHPFVVMFATKPFDATMDRLVSAGYLKMDEWRKIPAVQEPRRVLWPDARQLDAQSLQKAVFKDAMGRIYAEGGWTVFLDETWYLTNPLKLRQEIITYLTQSRSLEISMACATQRPAAVPVEIYDQSTHMFLWRDTDRANLDRLAEMHYSQGAMIRRVVSNLDRFQVLYVNTRTGRMLRTTAPLIREVHL